MSWLAVILVLASTFMHAGWNLLARWRASESHFFLHMLRVNTLLVLPAALAAEVLMGSLGPQAWGLAAASGLFCGVYYLGLGRGYESSDFSVVYPIVRGLPVVLVAAVEAAVGRAPSAIGWLAIGVILTGVFLAPLISLRQIHLARYLSHGTAWMLIAALGTTGYSLIDNTAADGLRATMPGPAAPLRYCAYFFVFGHLTYELLLAAHRRRAASVRQNPRALEPSQSDVPTVAVPRHAATRGRDHWRAVALAAVLNFGSYALIVWAYQLVQRASYVVACRQFSIVIGVAMAFALYGERGWRVRLPAAACITGGLVLLAVWGR